MDNKNWTTATSTATDYRQPVNSHSHLHNLHTHSLQHQHQNHHQNNNNQQPLLSNNHQSHESNLTTLPASNAPLNSLITVNSTNTLHPETHNLRDSSRIATTHNSHSMRSAPPAPLTLSAPLLATTSLSTPAPITPITPITPMTPITPNIKIEIDANNFHPHGSSHTTHSQPLPPLHTPQKIIHGHITHDNHGHDQIQGHVGQHSLEQQDFIEQREQNELQSLHHAAGGMPIAGAPRRGRRRKVRGEPVRPICPQCNKQFSNQSALTKHKLTHSDERRFVCSKCTKAFKRHDHLTGHMLTHSDRKPFACSEDGCEKTYCDARSLRRHKEHHHHIVGAVRLSTGSTTSIGSQTLEHNNLQPQSSGCSISGTVSYHSSSSIGHHHHHNHHFNHYLRSYHESLPNTPNLPSNAAPFSTFFNSQPSGINECSVNTTIASSRSISQSRHLSQDLVVGSPSYESHINHLESGLGDNQGELDELDPRDVDALETSTDDLIAITQSDQLNLNSIHNINDHDNIIDHNVDNSLQDQGQRVENHCQAHVLARINLNPPPVPNHRLQHNHPSDHLHSPHLNIGDSSTNALTNANNHIHGHGNLALHQAIEQQFYEFQSNATHNSSNITTTNYNLHNHNNTHHLPNINVNSDTNHHNASIRQPSISLPATPTDQNQHFTFTHTLPPRFRNHNHLQLHPHSHDNQNINNNNHHPSSVYDYDSPEPKTPVTPSVGFTQTFEQLTTSTSGDDFNNNNVYQTNEFYNEF